MSSSRWRDSSDEGGLTRRSMLRALVTAAIVAPGLAACGGTGFRPMYGSSQFGGNDLTDKLANVEVAPVPGRVGQRIRNELMFQTTGGKAPALPQYRLEMIMTESVSATLVSTNGDAIGSVYNVDVNFRLIRSADKSVVLTGKSYGRAGFERFRSIFANVRAREEAENRAALTVGQEVKSRLAAFLATSA